MNTYTPTAGAKPALKNQQMLDRVALLSGEIDANEEENRKMQEEITTLYASIDASRSDAKAARGAKPC